MSLSTPYVSCVYEILVICIHNTVHTMSYITLLFVCITSNLLDDKSDEVLYWDLGLGIVLEYLVPVPPYWLNNHC